MELQESYQIGEFQPLRETSELESHPAMRADLSQAKGPPPVFPPDSRDEPAPLVRSAKAGGEKDSGGTHPRLHRRRFAGPIGLLLGASVAGGSYLYWDYSSGRVAELVEIGVARSPAGSG